MAQLKTTFGGVDILRFLAAAVVMFHHYGFWVWAFPDSISARATGGIPPHSENGLCSLRLGRRAGVPDRGRAPYPAAARPHPVPLSIEGRLTRLPIAPVWNCLHSA
ncbi:hypothetical protein [Mesorhizobium sp. M2E.F.Ca.ET.209.01.1.1]|uniref:hypothetical protein n=1 Tax=Mesorhizobium sp. M2E.F.Ca.ET.209.01.1.1 TaxID=2500526 RepID=UPI001FEDED44|nr:hypothetical protein [Mesorhizobium sp. M2E.F.Ca.ET.209.01.1.1]